MKFFFAIGGKRKEVELLKECGVKNILVSANSLKSFSELENIVAIADDMDIFVDSGVATLLGFTGSKDAGLYVEELLDWYIRLVSFIRKELKGKIWCVANFDADLLLGNEKIDKINEEIFFPMVEEGFRVVFGWHKSRTINDIEKWIERGVNYIGISGFEGKEAISGQISLGGIENYVSLLTKKGIKVHAYGVSKMDTLLRYNFYSADSSTWSMPVRYGALQIFDNGRFISLSGGEDKWKRQQYRPLFIKYGLDPDKIIDDDPEECLKLSILSFLKMEAFLNRREQSSSVPKSKEEIQVLDMELGVVDPTAVFLCDRCFLRERCPFYEENGKCKLKFRPDIKDGKGLRELLMNVIKLQAERIMRGLMFEAIDGGLPSKVISEEIDRLMDVLRVCKSILGGKEEVVIKAEGGKGIQLLQELFGIKKEEQ
jgi:hypothetical protein